MGYRQSAACDWAGPYLSAAWLPALFIWLPAFLSTPANAFPLEPGTAVVARHQPHDPVLQSAGSRAKAHPEYHNRAPRVEPRPGELAPEQMPEEVQPDANGPSPDEVFNPPPQPPETVDAPDEYEPQPGAAPLPGEGRDEYEPLPPPAPLHDRDVNYPPPAPPGDEIGVIPDQYPPEPPTQPPPPIMPLPDENGGPDVTQSTETITPPLTPPCNDPDGYC